jgi:hypothetical protein
MHQKGFETFLNLSTTHSFSFFAALIYHLISKKFQNPFKGNFPYIISGPNSPSVFAIVFLHF